MAVTCQLSGRWGNCIFSLATLIAYAKKHDLEYFIPDEAVAYRHFRNGDVRSPLLLKSTGERPRNPITYIEPNHTEGTPCYHEIPKMDNVKLVGYFQSFLYFDWCREHILETFNFPYKMEKGVVSISVRRGDCIGVDAFPIAPKSYYVIAVNYMMTNGFNKFRVFSDDAEWCKNNFNDSIFPKEAVFEFSEGNEMEDYLGIMNSEHNITARSTFSLTAAWMNRNENKIVLVPAVAHRWWRGMNSDLLTHTNFLQIHFQNSTDEWSK